MKNQTKGRMGEELAATLLKEQGYEILERNYRFDRGEVDIVAKEGPDLVFIEVKARYGDQFGSPLEAVTPAKEEQLKKVAEGYLLQHGIENQSCRFDVVSIRYAGAVPSIEILKNAFV